MNILLITNELLILKKRKHIIRPRPTNPIETIIFRINERDTYYPNRFYFNYPAQLLTSNNGESVIDLRNIYLCARRRKLEFELFVRKYYKDYNDKLKHSTQNILMMIFINISMTG